MNMTDRQLYYAIKYDHLLSDEAYHVTLCWSEFMGGYYTTDSIVKDGWSHSRS